jgi:hypothetical protein
MFYFDKKRFTCYIFLWWREEYVLFLMKKIYISHFSDNMLHILWWKKEYLFTKKIHMYPFLFDDNMLHILWWREEYVLSFWWREEYVSSFLIKKDSYVSYFFGNKMHLYSSTKKNIYNILLLWKEVWCKYL